MLGGLGCDVALGNDMTGGGACVTVTCGLFSPMSRRLLAMSERSSGRVRFNAPLGAAEGIVGEPWCIALRSCLRATSLANIDGISA